MSDSKTSDSNNTSGTCIGIDLGTTYSCVAVWRDNRAEIIANDQGNRTTPSYVAFTEQERLIGDSAFNQSATNPSNTIYDAKRLIGRNYNDPQIQSDMKLLSYDVVEQNGDRIEVQRVFNNLILIHLKKFHQWF